MNNGYIYGYISLFYDVTIRESPTFSTLKGGRNVEKVQIATYNENKLLPFCSNTHYGLIVNGNTFLIVSFK